MERAYPIGHPAAPDYDGSPYAPSTAPFGQDFAPGHPASGGKNITPLDTPDGTHQRTVIEWQENATRTAANSGSAAQVQAAPEPSTQSAQSTTFTLAGDVQ